MAFRLSLMGNLTSFSPRAQKPGSRCCDFHVECGDVECNTGQNDNNQVIYPCTSYFTDIKGKSILNGVKRFNISHFCIISISII